MGLCPRHAGPEASRAPLPLSQLLSDEGGPATRRDVCEGHLMDREGRSVFRGKRAALGALGPGLQPRKDKAPRTAFAKQASGFVCVSAGGHGQLHAMRGVASESTVPLLSLLSSRTWRWRKARLPPAPPRDTTAPCVRRRPRVPSRPSRTRRCWRGRRVSGTRRCCSERAVAITAACPC